MKRMLALLLLTGAAFRPDAVAAMADTCTVRGTKHADVLTGTPARDVLCGFGGNDTIIARQGDDVLRGGGGADLLIGGQGSDRMLGGTERDEVSYRDAPAGIAASLRSGIARGEGDDRLRGVETLIGSHWNDTLEGSSAGDELRGFRGRDVVRGMDGDDVLAGGPGQDRVEGNMGNDRLDGGAWHDFLDGGFGADALVGGRGNDELNGGDGRDVLQGHEGDDVLAGGEGNDGCIQWEGDGKKLGCERAAYAVATGLALWIPSRNPVGFAYHESLFRSAIALRPLGAVRQNDSGRFDAPSATDGPDYVVMSSRGRAPGATTATDIVLPSRSRVLSPVDGAVVAVERYLLYCESADWKVVIQPDHFSSYRVLVLHMASPYVDEGDRVLAGQTPLGVTSQNDASTAQENAYFPDQYPHIHIEVERNGASPTPGCAL